MDPNQTVADPGQSKSSDEHEVVVDPSDWRIRIATPLTSDVPAAYPGGPSHSAGALVVQSTAGKDSRGRSIGFTTPSAVALALSLAIKAVDQSRVLRTRVEASEIVSPFGPSTSVTHESTGALYDYFE